MKRLRGPELKMPKLQAPGILSDFYHDLRDRRLLPVVALVLVAIVATPILLGQKSETSLSPAAGGAIAALRHSSEKSSSLTVVEAKPGLRDYRKRLRNRKPLDPFRSTGTPSLEGARLGKGEGEGSSSSATSTTVKKTSKSITTTKTTSTTTAGSGEGSEGGGGSPGGAGTKGAGKLGGKHPHGVLYAFGVDVTIVHSSGSEAEGDKLTSEPLKRKRVLPTVSLPGKKKQVVTYMGLSPKTRKPLFVVSPEVTGVFGEGKCSAGTSKRCQLIELEPGFPEVFEYGEEGDRYSIKVTNVEFVVTGHV
ncbi:MAG TPA: hypothetical protein VFG58_03065 [Solirubrobacterales bacterium]|nr:hypothetical protein [Solirubrobacterales bacterium]